MMSLLSSYGSINEREYLLNIVDPKDYNRYLCRIVFGLLQLKGIRAHCGSGVCGGFLVIVEGSPTQQSRSRADLEVRAQDAQGMQ